MVCHHYTPINAHSTRNSSFSAHTLTYLPFEIHLEICFHSFLGELVTTAMSANSLREVEEEAFISFPPSLFQLLPENDTFTLLFTIFNSSVLLPQAPDSTRNESIRVASYVIGATLLDYEIENLSNNSSISITLRLENSVS